MIGLNDHQFSILESRLMEAGLVRKTLYHDLLDHYYCLTESLVAKGVPFETAADEALKQMAPDGFKSVESELQFLLTFHFQISMKRLLYSGAYIATACQTLYVLFRNQHWAGATALLAVACLALFFMVIPALLVDFYQRMDSMSNAVKIRILTGIAGIALFGGGSVFKIWHFPGANIQLVLGTGILALLFFPLYFWQQYRQSVTRLA